MHLAFHKKSFLWTHPLERDGRKERRPQACFSCLQSPCGGAILCRNGSKPLYSRIAPLVGNVSLDEVREQFVCQQHVLHPVTDV
jgi:hypothetical protein